MLWLRGIIIAGIRNPVYANMLMVCLLAGGLASGMALVNETYPEFSLDRIAVENGISWCESRRGGTGSMFEDRRSLGRVGRRKENLVAGNRKRRFDHGGAGQLRYRYSDDDSEHQRPDGTDHVVRSRC